MNMYGISIWSWFVFQLCCQLNSPRENWGPAKDEHRTGRYSPREMVEIPHMDTNEPVVVYNTEKDHTIINGYDNKGYTNDNMYTNGNMPYTHTNGGHYQNSTKF